MKEIPLTQGKVAIVDDEDYEEASKYTWWYSKKGYAVTTRRKSLGRKNISMHILIAGKISEKVTDHINGNKLDNRRENLRHVTLSQNSQNQKPIREGTSSRYKGVHWHKKTNKWISKICIEGKRYHLGCYENERDAAWVYNVWAESFFGEYARLNVLKQ